MVIVFGGGELGDDGFEEGGGEAEGVDGGADLEGALVVALGGEGEEEGLAPMPVTSGLAEMMHSGSVLFGGGGMSMVVSQGRADCQVVAR